MRSVARALGLAGAGTLLVATSACGGSTAMSTVAATGPQQGPASSPTELASPALPVAPLAPAAPPGTSPAAAKATPKPSASPAPKASQPGTVKSSGSWKRAFAANAGAVSCAWGLSQFRASKAARLTFGSSTVFVGFQQYGNNQDPVFVRFDGSRKVYCEHHEHQSPDGRAMGLTWDGGKTAYVVYTIVGGGSELDAKASRGWIRSYGNGGASSKVMVVGQVELTYGTVQRASFVVSRLPKNGQLKTNSLVPVAAPQRLANGQVAVFGSAGYSPLNPDQSLMCSTGSEYPSAGPGRADKASYVGVFVSSLGSEVCAQTWGCAHVRKKCPNLK